jgi:hypothetical protein
MAKLRVNLNINVDPPTMQSDLGKTNIFMTEAMAMVLSGAGHSLRI